MAARPRPTAAARLRNLFGMPVNDLGQPIGVPVPGWVPRPVPDGRPLAGGYCRLERLDADRHAADLFAADARDTCGESWTYLPYGPFPDLAAFAAWMALEASGPDPLFYAILDVATSRALGVASLLRIDPDAGSIEVGHLHYSPLLQRQPAATEAMYLLMAHAFDAMRYRRCEWKCDALNAASRSAASRLGFQYEGTFRQARVVKGHNRDTAWYSVIDQEWPAVKSAFESWLDPANFDGDDRQLVSLAGFRGTPPLATDRTSGRA